MKTIEEKAKAYDEAIKIAESIHKFSSDLAEIKRVEQIFPELKEIEDEMIRKTLIEGFKDYGQPEAEWWNGVKVKDCIAWLEKQGEKVDVIENLDTEFEKQVSRLLTSVLSKEYEYTEGFVKWVANALLEYAKHEIEKQGEQKPTDIEEPNFFDDFRKTDSENEPKFKVGDWAVSNLDGKARQISEVHYDEYNSYYVVDGKSVNLEEYDRLHHLWTIQDAKDGDVLANENGIILFRKIGNNKYDDVVDYHCVYRMDGSEFEIQKGDHYWGAIVNSNLVHATKEQIEQLFKAMHEEGYTWDCEQKKLLRLIDVPQKPQGMVSADVKEAGCGIPKQELTELDKSVLTILNDVAYQGTFGNPSEDYLLRCWRKIGNQIANEISMTLSVSEEGWLESNIKKLIKQLKSGL